MSDYPQRYVDELLKNVAKEAPFPSSRVIGEITARTAKQPHVAIFLELGAGRFIGTTAGLSARPMPLPVKSGFQYFELCALTNVDSPKILWVLSEVGSYMLGSLSPLFYGDDEARNRLIAAVGETGASPEPKPFLPYQSLGSDEDEERFLFVPRFQFYVPQGPPVEVVEPLPLGIDDWHTIGPMTMAEREAWVRELGSRSAAQWDHFNAMSKL